MNYPFALFIGLLALTAFSFDDPPNKLVGRWQPKMPPGMTSVTIFRADNTFDIIVNGKLFVNGNYKVNGDTFAISDPICGPGYYGNYRLSFFAPDSVSYIVIEDTCRVRRSSMDGGKVGRVKASQTK